MCRLGAAKCATEHACRRSVHCERASMSSAVDDFVDVLEHESEVDLVRLADMAQHGVPSAGK